jgi:hypothetical protein
MYILKERYCNIYKVDKLEELKIRRLIKEYEYLLTEFDFRKEFTDKHKSSFLHEISKRRRELNIEEPPLEILMPYEESSNEDVNEFEKESTDESDENSEKTEVSESDIKLKKVFREIVKICHPDKIFNPSKRKLLTEIYIKAKGFYNEKNLIGLYLICIELGIDLSLEILDVSTIETAVEEKKTKVKSFESSYLWMWINSSEDEKIKIVDLFIKNNS